MAIFTLLSIALLVPTIVAPATMAQNDYYNIPSDEGTTYTVYRRDIEAELCKPVQRPITVQFDQPEPVNPTDTVLTLHTPQIVRDGSHLYLEATITKQAWERQQEWTKKKIQSMSDDMVFPALIGALITSAPTLLFFANGMFARKCDYSTLYCILDTDRGYAASITAGATAALYLLTAGLVARYWQTVALLRAICDNPRRIIGFSRIDTQTTQSADMIRIRSDFALDTMEHQTNRLCVCTAGSPHIHGKNV